MVPVRRRDHRGRMADTSTAPTPSGAMLALSRLIGTWTVTGGATGTVTYESMEGGHFILQRVQLEQSGQPVIGLEVIGHLRPFGEDPSPDVHSRFYDNAGNTLDYVYELAGDVLHIWAGERDSPAFFAGTFDATGTTISGAWAYPGGGGYESTMTRIR